jgi:ferredoxin
LTERVLRPLRAALLVLDGLFDRLYTSRGNPLYRSGTLAALFLTVALVSGVYLLLVYELGRPYESVVAIQNDPWLGRWMRALHRYASDAAVAAVAIHVLRVVVQGKTWGPRALAWITGLLLAGMLFLSGITGFVLVWDQFGQKLALTGARMLRLLPLFPEPPDRSFVGERPLPSQFFFMNLFLHVAVPLGMVAFLWLHTSKLARAAWFPERRVVAGTLAGLLALSVVWPAPLPPAADLLAVPGRVATDWFYAFWLPLAHGAPLAGLAVGATASLLLFATPWLLRPRASARPAPAAVDPEKCEGCRQCFMDCPYDAIEMVPGLHPERHALRASVVPDACVSCGLCAGSCASLAIGPPLRTGLHQLADARAFVAGRRTAGAETLVVACRNDGVAAHLARGGGTEATARFDVDCAGMLHPATISYLAARFRATVVVSCPLQNCRYREGTMLADARLLHERAPAVPGRIARQDVRVLHGSAAESSALRRWIAAPSLPPRHRLRQAALATAATAGILSALALGSRWPQGANAEHGVLRLGWRLAGQARQICRDRTADELAKLAVHMRTPRECTSEVPSYELTATVDGAVVIAKTITSPGLRADRPLSVEEDVPIVPGEHLVTVSFTPRDGDSVARGLTLVRRLRFEPARVRLVTYDGRGLIVR